MNDPIPTSVAAKILKLSPSRVRALALAGVLPAVRVGRDWVYERADVRAFKATDRPGRGRPPKGGTK